MILSMVSGKSELNKGALFVSINVAKGAHISLKYVERNDFIDGEWKRREG